MLHLFLVIAFEVAAEEWYNHTVKMNAVRLKTRWGAGAAIALACGLFVTVHAWGDTVLLKKGGHITGVISSESETSIAIKSSMGTIVLSRGAIAKIERATAEVNRALESQWEQERSQEEKKLNEAKRVEEEQRAKGLVKYQGTWITAEKAYEIEKGVARDKEEWEKSVEQQKRDLQEMEKRLRDLEARLEQRQREADFREQQLAFKEQNLLLQQQNLQRQAEQIAREKQQSPPKMFAIPRVEVVPPGGQP
ncbi:MAG: hypothetical protein NTX71_00290 [Candidatus Aureabacteria bacterium]|nr:hypothetical protein [Candidatus Auribacterota bacterium]